MTAVTIISGDITALNTDIIVCPANRHLIPGRGLSAQIHAKAGAQLDAECLQLGKCAAGEVRLTRAYQLPQQSIIHTVTPPWSSGDSWGVTALEQLEQCYRQACQLALSAGARSIAFPALGAGTNKTPQSVTAHIGLEVLTQYCDRFEQLIVCLHTQAAMHVWQETEKKYLSCHQTLASEQPAEPATPPTDTATAPATPPR